MLIIVLKYPSYDMSVWPLLVLSNWTDGNMNIIILRLHPTRGSPNNLCLVAIAWSNCSTRSDKRSVFGVSPRERPSGKKRQVLYNIISDPSAGSAGHESGPPAGSCKFATRRIRGSDPQVRPAGQPKTTRGSW